MGAMDMIASRYTIGGSSRKLRAEDPVSAVRSGFVPFLSLSQASAGRATSPSRSHRVISRSSNWKNFSPPQVSV